MDDMRLLEMAIDRGAAVNTYWNFYIVVTTAILGTMATGRPFTQSIALKLVLSGAFVLFALSNLHAILTLAELRTALLDLLPSDLEGRDILVKSLSPKPTLTYGLFHGLLDIVVLCCIWLVPWARLSDRI